MRGELSFLLDDNQLQMYFAILACPILQYVIQAARKIGKSFLLCVMAFEVALRHPKGRINYAAPTSKEAVEITLPIMNWLASHAPLACRPTWVPSLGHWVFPNEAFIVLFGADDQASADRGRGPESVLNIVDEAGFTPVLLYLLDSVLAPQTIQTKARTLIASTAPHTPGHDFCSVAEAAQIQNAFIHRDIYSHGRMSRQEIDEYLTQRALSRNLTLEQYKQTTDYIREYEARVVIDSNLAVVPEFPAVQRDICTERPRQPFFDLYLSTDLGMSDKTGVLFGVTDFPANSLSIEHELLMTAPNTKTIADAVMRILATYPKHQDVDGVMRGIVPYQAVIDATVPYVDRDLWDHHKLSFAVADKRDRESAINVMRLAVGSKRILIHPRCTHLIRQLGSAIRSKPGGDMIRTVRDGHFDLVAALIMMVRIWDNNKQHNPFPPDWIFSGQFAGQRMDPYTQGRRPVAQNRQTLADVLLSGTSLGRKKGYR